MKLNDILSRMVIYDEKYYDEKLAVIPQDKIGHADREQWGLYSSKGLCILILTDTGAKCVKSVNCQTNKNRDSGIFNHGRWQ